MFASSKTRARKIPSKDKEWEPHAYQDVATDFLLDRGAAALVLDPGLGKTSIVFAALCILMEEGLAKKTLVVAPLRVCQLVWRQEAKKWTQFKHLRITLLHGSKKENALREDSDIYLINPEGIAWLTAHLWGKKFPFDTVVIDELTKFKNAQAVRSKKLTPVLSKVKRVWGLTGSFLPNGYLDLFGQMKILDGGTALGFYFTHYRNKYFEKDFTGFNYDLRRGASKAIEAKVKPYVLRMSAKDYLELPPLIPDPIKVVMPPKARKKYEEMKKEMVAELEGSVVEAGNAAAVYSKLKQMANGAVYAGDGVFEPRETVHLHNAKIEALEELIEELAGLPLLVGYEFNHDLARIRKALGDVPYIGSGVSGDQAARIEKDWNANRIPVLLAHPASAGHGLNFQLGNAAHICWFSCTWDFELYDQFIKRIFRQGNEALRVFNHMLLVEDSIDNKTLDAIQGKQLTQSNFYAAINSEIYHDGKSDASPDEDEREDGHMAERTLERKRKRRPKEEAEDADYVEDDEAEEEEKPKRRPSRRRAKADDDEDEAPKRRPSRRRAKADEPDDDDGEEEKPKRRSRRSQERKDSGTTRKLRGDEDEGEAEEEDEPVSRRARKQFDKSVQDRLADDDGDDGDDGGDDEPAPRRRRSRKSEDDEDRIPVEKEDGDAYFRKIDYDKLANAVIDEFAARLSGDGPRS